MLELTCELQPPRARHAPYLRLFSNISWHNKPLDAHAALRKQHDCTRQQDIACHLEVKLQYTTYNNVYSS